MPSKKPHCVYHIIAEKYRPKVFSCAPCEKSEFIVFRSPQKNKI